MNPAGRWYGFNRKGEPTTGVLEAPSGHPVARFGPADITNINRERLPWDPASAIPSIIRDPPIAGATVEQNPQDPADRLLALYSAGLELYRFTVGRRGLAVDIGDIVEVTSGQFDLDAGKLLRVVEIEEKLDFRAGGEGERVTIAVFG